jgi:hypothetical protein
MTFSPEQERTLLSMVANGLRDDIRARMDLAELATVDISTAAQLLGLSTKQAGRILPVIELGPRTRRVRVADYQACLAERTKQPATR